ncbi:maleylpyruvate isomerase family mycothiol-dependent enzyme [Gordonia sp. MP11Mi]|uniref:Mycothiol-dependent maleylpyruvate isomerase metal-binding domain-containing protein n=1 Tax=Gordonia sp. MP11Mi TaxID=3022769 RepID=A0AA97GW67_9ACTN
MSVHESMLTESANLWSAVLDHVGDAALASPSGCPNWTNRDLINHVIGGGHRYAMLLDGASADDTVHTRDIDYVAEGAIAQFWRSEELLRASVDAADLSVDVDHRVGRRPGADLVPMRTMELTLHALDLCVGVGVEWRPADALALYLLSDAASIIEDIRGAGAFAPATEPVSSAPVDRLLAFAGRS